MIIYSELSIDSKPKKSTKMSVIHKLDVRMTKSNHCIARPYVNIHTKYEKYQNGCHLKTISQNNQKSNHLIVGINVNVHTNYEVSLTIYVGRRANQRKIPKWLPFKIYKSE